jgi:hypothetical protein
VKKFILGLVSTTWILLTSGTVFGWASFLLVYQEEGVFGWQCHNASHITSERLQNLQENGVAQVSAPHSFCLFTFMTNF